jgi:hypothetical protein
VIKRGEKIIGVEVKSGRQKSGKGVHFFSKRFEGAKILKIGGTDCDVDERDFLLSDPIKWMAQ